MKNDLGRPDTPGEECAGLWCGSEDILSWGRTLGQVHAAAGSFLDTHAAEGHDFPALRVWWFDTRGMARLAEPDASLSELAAELGWASMLTGIGDEDSVRRIIGAIRNGAGLLAAAKRSVGDASPDVVSPAVTQQTLRAPFELRAWHVGAALLVAGWLYSERGRPKNGDA